MIMVKLILKFYSKILVAKLKFFGTNCYDLFHFIYVLVWMCLSGCLLCVVGAYRDTRFSAVELPVDMRHPMLVMGTVLTSSGGVL